VRERKLAATYLRGLERAGARLDRLPAGVLDTVARGAEGRDPRKRIRPGTVPSALPGLADLDLDQALTLPIATLRAPFAYDWTWTKWIHYAPGTLSAHANATTGAFGVKLASDHDSNQVNKSRARAGIGIRYQPTERGVLGIVPKIEVRWAWRLKTKMRVARTFGWTGLLVQSFDVADDTLASTPVDRRRTQFDESEGGGAAVVLPLPPAEFTVVLPDEGMPSLFVDPARWYTIWLWCGGGIRAAGWQTVAGVNVGSDAASRVDVTVESIKLYFTPVLALGAR
jgi:hypothetical protein